MTYAIDMLEFFGKIKDDKVKIDPIDTITVLARRVGAPKKEGVPPKKFSDEPITKPREPLDIPTDIKLKAEELVQGILFTPENLRNLRKLKYENGNVYVEANYVNYGSMAVMRPLSISFEEERILPVMNQVAGLAMSGIMFSEKYQSIYLGRRGKTLVGGKWMGYPAGGMNEKSNLADTSAKETLEEAGFVLDEDGTAYLIGAVRGRYHSANPNFNYLIYTDWDFKKLWERTNKIEHDLICAVPLDEKALREYIKENLLGAKPNGEIYDKTVDNGLGNMLQAGRVHFSNGWYFDTVKELMDPPFGIRIMENNLFA